MKTLPKTNKPSVFFYQQKNQTGSTMFLSLLILVVLTLLSVFATSSGIMQERMAGNFRDSSRAFQAAELGVRWYEAWFASLRDISQQPFACDGDCIPGTDVVWELGNYPADALNETANWWTVNGTPYGIDPATLSAPTADADEQAPLIPSPYVRTQPSILVEHIFFARDELGPNSTGVQFYRITSRASGGIDNNIAVVESTFARRFE